MPNVEEIGGIRVDTDSTFDNKWQRWQPFGWALIAIIVFAGLVGLVGPGPASKGRVYSAESGLRIEYEKVVRNKRPTIMSVYFSPGQSSAQSLMLEGTVVRNFRPEGIVPWPSTIRTAGEAMIFEFQTSNQQATEHLVTFTFQPRAIGQSASTFSLGNRPPVRIEQLVLP